MCAVSMVSDFYRDKWPGHFVPAILPSMPPMPSMPTYPINPLRPGDSLRTLGRFITAEEWQEYQALKSKAVEYDIRNNEPDCVKPDVDAWEQDIEAFLILMGLLTEDDLYAKGFA